MNRFRHLQILLLTIVNVYGLYSQIKKVESTSLSADTFVGVDKFNQLYYTKDNILFKQSEDKQTIAFQDFLLGDIEKVDILNPNKILVFYKLANTIVVLDNRLTEIDRQDFNTLSPYKNVNHAGISKDQGVWLYNIDLNQLELFDYRFDKLISTSLPINEQVLQIKNNFNLCFLQKENSIEVYNVYGSLVNSFNFKKPFDFDVYKNQILVIFEDSLKIYDQDFEVLKNIKTTLLHYKNLFFNGKNIYLYDGKILTHYAIY